MSGDEHPGPATAGANSEFGVGNYSTTESVRPSESPEFRQNYGRLRTYYRHRPEQYRELQRWLNQARFGTNYDRYLERSALYSIVAIFVGVVVGYAVTFGLVELGYVQGLTNPFAFRGDLTVYLGENRALFAGAALAIVFAVVSAAATWYGRYFYPRNVAANRRRSIDVTLPHAITFMYALSYGGMDLLSVVERLAEAEDTYGEVAGEFQTVVSEVDLFGNDLYTALENTRNVTPSDNLEQFIDDLLSVLDSGGDVTVFLEDETDTYLEEARDQQDGFIETLALLSEVFVVLFVAAPLFVIVLLVVMSLLGANTITQVTALVYLILPLAMLGFLVLLDTLSSPFDQADVTLETEGHATAVGDVRLLGLVVRDLLVGGAETVTRGVASVVSDGSELAVTDEEHVARQQTAYLRRRRRQHLVESARTPFSAFNDQPLLTAALTVPLAAATVAIVASSTGVQPSQAAFLAAPVETTLWFVVVPLLIVGAPLTLFVERQNYRERFISREFPDTLNALSSANRMGVGTTDALELVAKWSSGPIGRELQRVSNDIKWNHDPARALRSFADQLRVPQLSRSMKLVAEGLRSSSDLARVLSIAADDTRNRFKIEQKRRRELNSYVAVVVIGYLVYLLVVVLLTEAYLEPIASTPAVPDSGGRTTPISISNLPVAAYEVLFLHSAVIQAVGAGLLAGKLVENRALSGLKYSLVLVVIAIATFALI